MSLYLLFCGGHYPHPGLKTLAPVRIRKTLQQSATYYTSIGLAKCIKSCNITCFLPALVHPAHWV